ncbi:MAG: hypothetical protein JXR73_02980 [Candidatus Omnitrophica bacterium]|nr:hypothetical protein [Candidatus Omnitrophota bacterium]
MHPSRNPEIERRNLELIRSLYPSYAEILSSIHPETAPYKIESISSDAFACQKKGPDGGAHWLHGPDNPW